MIEMILIVCLPAFTLLLPVTDKVSIRLSSTDAKATV